jgi:hypothetical protein
VRKHTYAEARPSAAGEIGKELQDACMLHSDDSDDISRMMSKAHLNVTREPHLRFNRNRVQTRRLIVCALAFLQYHYQ